MNQSVEMKIEEATIVASSETIRSRVIRQSLLRNAGICTEGVSKAMGVDDTDTILVMIYNYCIFSARIKVTKGKLPFELLLPSDSEEMAIEKSLAFFEAPYTEAYEKLVGLINRIDLPESPHLTDGAGEQYVDMTDADVETLPEDEKKS